jgi:hypothetical protein
VRFGSVRELREWLAEASPETLFADGFEDAIVGVGVQGGKHNPVVVYDRERCIKILMARDGMSEDEAEEFFCFNTEGAWMGDYTPVWLSGVGDGERGVKS